MTREEKKQELVALFATGAMPIGELIDECFAFADAHPHWISVEDELPPLRQWVLAYNGVTIYIAWVSDDFVWRTHKEHCFRTYPVTHWMPLPKMPILSNSENIGKDLKGGEQ